MPTGPDQEGRWARRVLRLGAWKADVLTYDEMSDLLREASRDYGVDSQVAHGQSDVEQPARAGSESAHDEL